jgi:hypothetical protein
MRSKHRIIVGEEFLLSYCGGGGLCKVEEGIVKIKAKKVDKGDHA